MTTSLAGNVTRKLASLESMSGHYGLLYAMFVLTDGHLSPPPLDLVSVYQMGGGEI